MIRSKLKKLQLFNKNGYIKHCNRNSTYIDLHYYKRPNEGGKLCWLQIDVNSRVSTESMHGCMQMYGFTFPIAVTVVFSLRLPSEHPKLSLSSSSAETISSRSRELGILTTNLRYTRIGFQTGGNHAAFREGRE